MQLKALPDAAKMEDKKKLTIKYLWQLLKV